jgi:hypothetical protein
MKILWNGNESTTKPNEMGRGPNEISQWKFYEMVMKVPQNLMKYPNENSMKG